MIVDVRFLSNATSRDTMLNVYPVIGDSAITIVVEAVYENGVLKPEKQLPFGESERVQVTVDSTKSRARQTAGLMNWNGSTELADRFALDTELDPQEGT